MPVNLRCDFCMAPDPTWNYPCKSFQYVLSLSVDDWTACEICHGLIEAGDREGLTRRCAEAVSREHPEMEPIWVRSATREVHDLFFAHRVTPERMAVS